jgi:hypothetical protein
VVISKATLLVLVLVLPPPTSYEVRMKDNCGVNVVEELETGEKEWW